MKKDLSIDFITERIIVSKNFLNRASEAGSPEYYELIRTMNELPKFQITLKTVYYNCNQITYRGLTIDAMKDFMRNKSREEQSTFEQMLVVASYSKGGYFKIRKWFLSKYKEEWLENNSYLAA